MPSHLSRKRQGKNFSGECRSTHLFGCFRSRSGKIKMAVSLVLPEGQPLSRPDPNLILGMRQLNGVYTQIFNRRHSRVGHVFQDLTLSFTDTEHYLHKNYIKKVCQRLNLVFTNIIKTRNIKLFARRHTQKQEKRLLSTNVYMVTTACGCGRKRCLLK